jgi:hypothetical protein
MDAEDCRAHEMDLDLPEIDGMIWSSNLEPGGARAFYVSHAVNQS